MCVCLFVCMRMCVLGRERKEGEEREEREERREERGERGRVKEEFTVTHEVFQGIGFSQQAEVTFSLSI